MDKIDPEKMRRAIALYEGGMPLAEIMRISGIGKSSIYRELDRLELPKRNSRKQQDARQ